MKQLNRKNTSEEKKTSGVYAIYSAKRRLAYIGSSTNIRRRVSSYHQKDDFDEHPTKRALRPHAKFYRVEHMPIKEARKKEKARKAAAPFNVSVAGRRRAAHKKKSSRRRRR